MKRLLLMTLLSLLLIAPPALAQDIPPDKYDPKGPEVSEKNFRATLAKEKLAWVMYDDSDPAVPKNLRAQGEAFWKLLKTRFKDQVKAFIRIDTHDWSDGAMEAKKEIMENSYPSYALYQNGYVVNVGTNYAVIINGAPLMEQVESIIEFVLEVSPLK